MVIKGEIKSIDFTNNKCMVRMPFFESSAGDEIVASALFSNTPGSYNGYKEGDIVYVAFENGEMQNPVVIGKLYLGAAIEEQQDRGTINCTDFRATNSAIIPISTQIDYTPYKNRPEDADGITKFKTIADLISGIKEKQDSINFNTTTISGGTTIYGMTVNGNDYNFAGGGSGDYAVKNADNNFSTTQTINGSDDTPLNLKANHATWSNIALFNSSGTRLGNIGANGNSPYWWAGSGGTSGQIALISDIPSTSNFVTLGGTQTITGEKSFSNHIYLNGNNGDSYPIHFTYQYGEDDGDDAVIMADYTHGGISITPSGLQDPDNYLVIKPSSLLYVNESGTDYEYSFPAKSGTLALTRDLPTKTSDLTNDSGYLQVSNNSLIINSTSDNLQATIVSPSCTFNQGNLSAFISSDNCQIGSSVSGAEKNGRQTIISSKGSTTNGNDTTIISARDSVISSGNTEGTHSTESAIIGGYENQITNTTRAVIVGGIVNKIDHTAESGTADDAYYGFIGGGSYNTVRHRNAATLGGQHLITNGPEQVIVGRYNSTSNASSILFAVGNGSSSSSRSNAFSVLNDGTVKVGQLVMSKPLVVSGGDSSSAAKISLDQNLSGQITDNGTKTLFGFTNGSASNLTIGHNSYSLSLRGSGTRPTYNGHDIALYSDTSISNNYSIAYNLVVNSNGYQYSGYKFADITISGLNYTIKQFQVSTTSAVVTDTSIIKDYLKVMTGRDRIPEYDEDCPTSEFIVCSSNNTIWKLQYDSTNGLLAFKIENMPSIFPANEVSYLTTAPTANNTSGRLKFVVLSSEPATYYDGYYYIITGSNS